MGRKDTFESSMIPKCLCSSSFITDVLLKRISGWSVLLFFLENISSTACFFGSGLNDILQSCARCLINSKSWFMSLAAESGSLTTVNNDVSSAKSLTLHFKSSVRSFLYTRKNEGPRIEPWGTPAEISPQEELPIQNSSLSPVVEKTFDERERRCPETPQRFNL